MTPENGEPQSPSAAPAPDGNEQMTAVLRKLDDIQLELETRNRQLADLRELQDDFAVIAKDMFQSAAVELDEVAPFIQTGDFLALMKRLLRNVNRISDSLIALESATDFVADGQPIAHDLFHRFIVQLSELEQKGYFRVAEELQTTLGELVETVEKVNLLPAIRQGLKSVRETDSKQFERYSLPKLYRDTKTPEVRRLLGVTVALIQAVARELPASQDQPN